MPPVERLTIPEEQLHEQLLPQLEGRVFHVTPLTAFARIQADGFVRPSDGSFPFSWPSQSRNSYFRNRSCVSLVDLRAVPEGEADLARAKFNYLNPGPCKNEPVFLFLSPHDLNSVRTWPDVRKQVGPEMIVPHIESGHPGPIALDRLARILHVSVTPSADPLLVYWRNRAGS